jgi:aspartyl-tRNA(Asn)/glutamyl-tRNA(Gln) amidotransferase subunit B
MYQSHVYLETRILVLPEKKAFIENFIKNKNKYITLDAEVASILHMLADVFCCRVIDDLVLEHLTGSLDVPAEYKVSGYSLKVAETGFLDIEFHRRKKTIHIEEIRIEEDTGRLTRTTNRAYMDYSNAGCPSIRIRTGADFELGEEAELFLNELRRLVQYLGIITDVPFETMIRCNAYAALAVYPNEPNYYVKLRNLNSFNFVRKAINTELGRQEEILDSDSTVISESRLWNERQNTTERYKLREPNVCRFEAVDSSIQFIFPEIQPFLNGPFELPEPRRLRLSKKYGLSRSRAEFICDDKNRADYFEATIAAGADAMDAAHWISSEFARFTGKNYGGIADSPLTPEYFAEILILLKEGRIHSGIARQLMQSVFKTGKDPRTVIKVNNWTQIAGETELLPIVKEVIASNPNETEKLRAGEMSPLEFLTGKIMHKTGGMAVPQTVKRLLKRELNIKLIYVLSMGGAICGRVNRDGSAQTGEADVLAKMLDNDGLEGIRTKVIQVNHLWSEEVEPGDWAALIKEITACIESGTASGIVIAYGTDTLPYTAALLYWLFADANVPIVIASAHDTPDASDIAQRSMNKAVLLAAEKKEGVYVVFDDNVFSPLNLKFIKPEQGGFCNWNMDTPVFTGSDTLYSMFLGLEEPDEFVMRQILREAANTMLVCRVYPGLKSSNYLPLVDNGVRRIIIELYETGTGSMRDSDYSIKNLLQKGRKKGCRFYCTSQQDSSIDFSGYTTSRSVWREGATPMGRLTTESAVGLYFAASLVADNQEELDNLLEAYSTSF